MSLIGVYPNINIMNKDQLIKYCLFVEAQAITKEMDQEDRIEYLEHVLNNYSKRLKELENE